MVNNVYLPIVIFWPDIGCGVDNIVEPTVGSGALKSMYYKYKWHCIILSVHIIDILISDT